MIPLVASLALFFAWVVPTAISYVFFVAVPDFYKYVLHVLLRPAYIFHHFGLARTFLNLTLISFYCAAAWGFIGACLASAVRFIATKVWDVYAFGKPMKRY